MGENETLSTQQANKIISEYANIIENARKQIKNNSQNFLEKVKNQWEDNNTITFAKSFKENIENIDDNMVKNVKIFSETLQNIASMYYTVGNNLGTVKDVYIHSNMSIDISNILNHFTNGENDNAFGFKNTDAGADEILADFRNLSSILEDIMTEVKSSINSIEAFGNKNVTNGLAVSASLIVQYEKNQIKELNTKLNETLEETIQAYVQTGNQAVGAAQIGVSTGGGQQMLYAPPTSNSITSSGSSSSSGSGTSTTSGQQMLYAPPTSKSITLSGSSSSSVSGTSTTSGQQMLYAPPTSSFKIVKNSDN